MQNKTILNSNYALVLAVINTILVCLYLFNFGEVSEDQFFYYTICIFFIISVHLGFITYFDQSPTKKIFKTLTIIFSVIFILSFILTGIFFSYASGWNH